MNNPMLKAALDYHSEGLCVIPIVERDKRPAIDWIEYHERRSTQDEVLAWFGNGHNYNCGIVHGQVSDNYITFDIDHDNGIFEAIRGTFPALVAGRIEQSGSWQGYHIPLKVALLPEFGIGKNGPKGNRTWHTPQGDVNIRARFCQTVAPPSIHPSGNPYRFIQEGGITAVDSLADVMLWLDTLCPETVKPLPQPKRASAQPAGDNLIEAVKKAWGTPLNVFDHFGWTNDVKIDNNDEIRLLGHGGLLLTAGEPQLWYCFADEIGGGIIEAWGYCRFGRNFDNRADLRRVLVEMAQSAGIDVAQYYRRGDETATQPATGDRSHWTQQKPVLSKLRDNLSCT